MFALLVGGFLSSCQPKGKSAEEMNYDADVKYEARKHFTDSVYNAKSDSAFRSELKKLENSAK